MDNLQNFSTKFAPYLLKIFGCQNSNLGPVWKNKSSTKGTRICCRPRNEISKGGNEFGQGVKIKRTRMT